MKFQRKVDSKPIPSRPIIGLVRTSTRTNTPPSVFDSTLQGGSLTQHAEMGIDSQDQRVAATEPSPHKVRGMHRVDLAMFLNHTAGRHC